MTDVVGERALRVMASAKRYNDWIMGLITPWLGHQVAEAGAGLGTFVGKLVGMGKQVTAVDISADYLARTKSAYPQVETFRFDLQSASLAPALAGRFDSVYTLNVLEHVANHQQAIVNLYQMLQPGGRLIILVPAGKWAFGTLDKHLGHVRRYTASELKIVVQRAGFQIKTIRYINFLGLIGWTIASRILKTPEISLGQVGLFELIGAPFLSLERYLTFPWGLSLLCVVEK